MINYLVKKHVDYISCSVSQFMTADDIFGQWHDTNPRQRNYNKAKIFDIGMVIQWNTERPKMKINIIVSGETLQRLRDAGIADRQIIKWLSNMPDCKFSRIDICVTSKREDGGEHEFKPDQIHFMANSGLCVTKLKLDKPVTNQDLNVETAYIGSRTSRNRLFRAYDKGLELGGAANEIIRYELETRKNATHIAREIEFDNTDIGALIRRYVDFPQNDVWIEILGSKVADNWRIDEYVSESDKNKSRWQWLFDSVAPAMAKALYTDDIDIQDNENADKFSRLVAFHYNKLIDKSNT